MANKFSLKQIEQAIEQAPAVEQQQLLKDLPRLLHIPPAELSLLKNAEPSFAFWNNPDDAKYDQL